MAEKFMTRRERREAERRQADAAYDAQQAAKAEAADEAEAPTAVPDAPAAPEQDAPEAATTAPEAAEPQVEEPELPAAPPRPTVEPDRAAASQPEPLPAAPRFSSRSERKRFLRDHDLPPDIATASIPIVLAQRASGEAPAGTAVPEAPAETTAPEAAAEPRPTDAAAEPADAEPVVPQAAEPAAEPDAEPALADEAGREGTAEANAELTEPPAPPAPPEETAADWTGPQFDLASRRVDAHATGPDFETSSTAVITPSALGDFDQPIKRRSPVVKPPTGSNIRVVTGALPVVTPEDLEANPPTTPMSAIDAEGLAADDRGTGTFRTSEAPVFRASRPVNDPWAQLGDSAEEEEDSDELEEPPARPMSARSVTNEDGTVLVAERNSVVPFIVLGATGFAALVLVIVAITLLF